MDLAQWLGWIATFLFSVMYLPQIHKTIKLGSVKDVSLTMFLMNFIANVIALTYALLIDQKPLVIKYVIALVVIALYLVIYFKILRRK
jgi:uncharacterized protein with PQ loop repeat